MKIIEKCNYECGDDCELEKHFCKCPKHMIKKFSKTKPLLSDLPLYVKDPKNYRKIELALLETLACSKSHGEVIEMAECRKCTENMLVRRQLMKKFGFKTVGYYMAWKKVMHVMTNPGKMEKMRLTKYNT